MASLGGEFDRLDRNRSRLAGALDAQLHGPPDDIADEVSLEVANALDRAAIELDHDVADAQAGLGGRSGLEQLDDLETA